MTDEIKYETISNNDLLSIYEAVKFKGFERDEFSKIFISKFGLRICQEIAFIVALRGPVKALDISVSSAKNKTIRQLGIRHGAKGKEPSPSRICACFADYAAWALKKVKVPKRLNVDCPAWLQFPSAGGIDMPADLRQQHREFSIMFSEAIGGEFRDSIYESQVANAYCSPALRLF